MHNPVTYLETKYKEVHNAYKGWLAKQSLPIETAVVTLTGAAQGAVVGFIATFAKDSSSTPPPGESVNPDTMASFQKSQVRIDFEITILYGEGSHDEAQAHRAYARAGGPLIHARNYAVMTGVNAGISSVLKRLRGKEDVQTSMVAAFGSGAMFSLVSNAGGTNQAKNVITAGVFFALVQGVLFKVSKKFLRPSGKDVMYSETRAMLSSLDLEKYEKNFKKRSLTDSTLPQLTDKALQDIKIPPELRLVILDHIQRSKEVKKNSPRT